MDEKDLEEYHNIGRISRKSEIQYISWGRSRTTPESGTRVYEINNYRLPSVTTILGATKNQDFIKKWKAKSR